MVTRALVSINDVYDHLSAKYKFQRILIHRAKALNILVVGVASNFRSTNYLVSELSEVLPTAVKVEIHDINRMVLTVAEFAMQTAKISAEVEYNFNSKAGVLNLYVYPWNLSRMVDVREKLAKELERAQVAVYVERLPIKRWPLPLNGFKVKTYKEQPNINTN